MKEKEAPNQEESMMIKPNQTKFFLGNLPYNYDTESKIKDIFKGLKIIECDLHMRDGRFAGRASLSFEDSDSAQKALKYNGEDIDGRNIKVEISQNKPRRDDRGTGGGSNSGGTSKPPGCTTIFLGNLSFNIVDEDIKKFFKDCGTVTEVRKIDRDGRFSGVCFVEFSDTEATDKAVELNGKELLGRDARIDFAKPKGERSDRGGRGGGRGYGGDRYGGGRDRDSRDSRDSRDRYGGGGRDRDSRDSRDSRDRRDRY